MRRRVIFTAAVLCFGQVGAEESQQFFSDGHDLWESCGALYEAESIGYDRGSCFGYVEGATDSLTVDGIICIPDGTKFGQVLDVVVEYLRDHLDEHDEPAADLVFFALDERWPCPD
jgi:hypothetical protein